MSAAGNARLPLSDPTGPASSFLTSPRASSTARVLPGPPLEGKSPPPAGQDRLSRLAPLLRVRPEAHSLSRSSTSSHFDQDAGHGRWVTFHIITNGSWAIHLLGYRPRSIVLGAGDLVMLPRTTPHKLEPLLRTTTGCAPGAGCDPEATSGRQPARRLSGRLSFEHTYPDLVLSPLPEAIVVAGDGPDAARIQGLVTAAAAEVESARAGGSAIASDIASAFFVMVVRLHFERDGPHGGLLGLLAHRQAGRAVAAMLEDPGRPWTLDTLATCANASRASLVRMFRKLVHVAPVEYLSTLRLELARCKLATSSAPLGDIAAEVGYQSESAFSRAFRRRFGIVPSKARTSAGSPSLPGVASGFGTSSACATTFDKSAYGASVRTSVKDSRPARALLQGCDNRREGPLCRADWAVDTAPSANMP